MYHPMYHGERSWGLMSANRKKAGVGGIAYNPQILLFLLMERLGSATGNRTRV